MVFSNQQAYYDAIAASSRAANSAPFIDFMLGEILSTLKKYKGEELSEVPNKVSNKVPNKSERQILSLLRKDGTLTMAQLSAKTRLSESGVKKILSSLKQQELIVRIGSNKTGYWNVKDIADLKKFDHYNL